MIFRVIQIELLRFKFNSIKSIYQYENVYKRSTNVKNIYSSKVNFIKYIANWIIFICQILIFSTIRIIFSKAKSHLYFPFNEPTISQFHSRIIHTDIYIYKKERKKRKKKEKKLVSLLLFYSLKENTRLDNTVRVREKKK